MERNRARSVEWCRLEAPVLDPIAEADWEALGLDDYPAGLDYFMLDSCLLYGRNQSLHWLDLSLGIDDVRCGSIPMIDKFEWLGPRLVPLLVVGTMAGYRKRRLKTEPGWKANNAMWVNRLLRAHKRATKLVREAEMETT